jgi:hypothetical protein
MATNKDVETDNVGYYDSHELYDVVLSLDNNVTINTTVDAHSEDEAVEKAVSLIKGQLPCLSTDPWEGQVWNYTVTRSEMEWDEYLGVIL